MSLFVAEMSYIVGTVAAWYDTSIVLLAATACCAIAMGLTVFALVARTEDTLFCGSFVVVFTLPLMICSLFLIFANIKFDYTLYCLVGTIIYGVYLVWDTHTISKVGKSKYGLTYDDYAIASLLIYFDIVMMFLYILSLFGKK